MMPLKFCALPSAKVEALKQLKPDANGQTPERHVSDGSGNPCRHCLSEIPEGVGMLILAYRPFEEINPYAEVGPLFLCAERCQRHDESAGLPDMYRGRGTMLLRGYSAEHRIVYGTGIHVETKDVEDTAAQLLKDDRVAYVHMRSPTDTCYHLRIERG